MNRIVLTLFAVALVAVTLPSEVEALHRCCGDPPNRQPIANAGPDITIAETSKLILDACGFFEGEYEELTDEEFRKRCRSYDPDFEDDLEYEWTFISSDFGDVVPLQKCVNECDPEDWESGWWTPYLPPGGRSRITLVFELTVYDRGIGQVNNICGDHNPMSEGYCGDDKVRQEVNHKDSDRVTVTVVNTNQAPHGWDLDKDQPSTPDKEEPDWIYLTFEPETVDIVEDHKKGGNRFVNFQLIGWDDREIVASEVYLYDTDRVDLWEKQTKEDFECQFDAVPHTVRFGLGRQHRNRTTTEMDPGGPGPIDYPRQSYWGQTNPIYEFRETWAGRLSVDHANLVVGDYRVCGRMFDGEGGNGTSSPEVDLLTVVHSMDRGQGPPCLTLLQLGEEKAIRPDVPEKPTSNPVNRFECTQPPVPADDNCDVYPPQVLGPGQIMRLDARIKPFGLPQDPDLYDPHTEYLMEKVTYQVDLTRPGEAEPILGTETEIRQPYILNLETLAPGAQRVHVRAYDRAGGMSQICVPVTTDTNEPATHVVHENPIFQGVPSIFRVYLHDQVDARSVLEVKKWIGGTAPLRESRRTTDVGNPAVETVHAVPALGAFPHADINRDGMPDALYDSATIDNPNLIGSPTYVYKLDRYFDYATQTIHVLRAIDCDGDRVPDLLEDLNGDKVCDPLEPAIKMIDPKMRADFPDGFAYNDILNGTMELPEDLADFLQSNPSYIFEYTLNATGLGKFDWTVFTRDDALNVLVDRGNFTVLVYEADVSVAEVSEGTGAPYLPGDDIMLNATLRHDSNLTAGKTGIPMYFSFAKTNPFTELPANNTQALLDLMTLVDSKKARQALCADPTVAGAQIACAVLIGDFVNVTQEFDVRPGEHTIRVAAMSTPFVRDTDPSNNEMNYTFEVFLGRTDVGKDRQFHIRADARGLPRLEGGVIDLELGTTWNMNLDLAGDRYEWTVGNDTYYWNPDERRDPADTKKECELDSKTQTFPTACRPITVYKADPEPEPEQESPGIGILLGVALLGVALVRRRRDDA